MPHINIIIKISTKIELAQVEMADLCKHVNASLKKAVVVAGAGSFEAHGKTSPTTCQSLLQVLT